jgi:hypothetical protein
MTRRIPGTRALKQYVVFSTRTRLGEMPCGSLVRLAAILNGGGDLVIIGSSCQSPHGAAERPGTVSGKNYLMFGECQHREIPFPY